MVNDCTSVAKLSVFFPPESEISLWIRQNQNLFVESLDRFRSRSTRKGKKCFCDEPASVWPHRTYIKFFYSISRGFSRFFRSYFVLPNFWSLRNLIIQLFHLRLLVIANSALRALLWLFTISYPTSANGMIVKYPFALDGSILQYLFTQFGNICDLWVSQILHNISTTSERNL